MKIFSMEDWLRNKIASLRAEATELENVLSMYLAQTSQSHTIYVSQTAPKTRALIKLYADHCKNDEALSYAQMEELAVSIRYYISPSSLRQLVFRYRKLGFVSKSEKGYH